MRYFWVFVLLIANTAGIIGPMFDFWKGPAFRTGRTIVYLSSAGASFLPVVLHLLKHGHDHLPRSGDNPALTYVGFMLLQYILGAIVYASRFPERLAPGWFDLLGHSHQLWHLIVISATVTLYHGIVHLIVWRLENENMCHELLQPNH